MIYKKLKLLAKELNWYRTDDSVFGHYNGYCVNIFQSKLLNNPSNKLVHIKTPSLSENRRIELNSFLDENKKECGFKNHEIGADYLSVIFFEAFKMTKNKKLLDYLNLICKKLNSIGLEKLNIENNNYKHYNLSGTGVLLNFDEVNKFKTRLQKTSLIEINRRTSYTKGMIGSFIFCIPIIALWILIAIYLNLFTAAGGFLMALAAYYGYEKFNGKKGYFQKWSLGIISIISIIIATVSIYIFDGIKTGLTFNETISLIQDNQEIQNSIYVDLGLGLFLGLLGVFWLIWGLNTKGEYIDTAKKVH